MPAGLDGNPDPIVSPERTAILEAVSGLILSRKQPGVPLLVGIDGVDGSGKSTFADELGRRLESNGPTIVRSTIDSFHNPRSIRWRLGKTSPFGFYRDSHDLAGVTSRLLKPFRAGAGAAYRTALFDEPSNQPIDTPSQTISGDEILLFDGIFLHRPELASYWDYSIFLDGKQRLNLQRLGYVLADRPTDDVELIDHVLTWVERIERYSSGMRIYLDAERPERRADLVIDNNDLARPRMLEPKGNNDNGSENDDNDESG